MKKKKNLLGNRIRELRKRQGLTQGEFAKKLNITQARVSRIENGVDNLYTEEQLEPFAKALNTTVEDLKHYQDKRIEVKNVFYITLVDKKGFIKCMELTEFPGDVIKILDRQPKPSTTEFVLEKNICFGTRADDTELYNLEYHEKLTYNF